MDRKQQPLFKKSNFTKNGTMKEVRIIFSPEAEKAKYRNVGEEDTQTLMRILDKISQMGKIA